MQFCVWEEQYVTWRHVLCITAENKYFAQIRYNYNYWGRGNSFFCPEFDIWFISALECFATFESLMRRNKDRENVLSQ